MKGNRLPQPFRGAKLLLHVTTAYDILRHCGVEIGKRDFIGTIPMKMT